LHILPIRAYIFEIVWPNSMLPIRAVYRHAYDAYLAYVHIHHRIGKICKSFPAVYTYGDYDELIFIIIITDPPPLRHVYVRTMHASSFINNTDSTINLTARNQTNDIHAPLNKDVLRPSK